LKGAKASARKKPGRGFWSWADFDDLEKGDLKMTLMIWDKAIHNFDDFGQSFSRLLLCTFRQFKPF